MIKNIRTTAAFEVIDTQTEQERLEQLVSVASAFYPEPIEDVFISEYRQGDGRQVIASVWFFTANLAVEFKNPLTEERFDLALLKGSVDYLEATKENFDFSEWTEESRFSVNFKLTSGITGDLRATRRNCLELLRLLRERFFGNLANPAGAQRKMLE